MTQGSPNVEIVNNAVTLQLGTPVSLTLWMYVPYRKMDKIIHGNCACIQSAFSAYRTELTKDPSAPFESA